MTLFIAALKLLLAALLGTAQLASEKGLATRFGDPGDMLTGGNLSCTGVRVGPDQLVCAHRTLPCGSIVWLRNPRTKRFAVCEIADRGPFGAILPSGEWGLKIRPEEPGVWRGVIDLAPAVAEALDFNGREKIQVVYQKMTKRHRGRLPRILAAAGMK